MADLTTQIPQLPQFTQTLQVPQVPIDPLSNVPTPALSVIPTIPAVQPVTMAQIPVPVPQMVTIPQVQVPQVQVPQVFAPQVVTPQVQVPQVQVPQVQVPQVQAHQVQVAVPQVQVPVATPQQATRVDYVTYDTYSSDRLRHSHPEKKTVPGTGPNAKPPVAELNYYTMGLNYNVSLSDVEILDDFLLEGPPMTSRGGIVSKTDQFGKVQYSIMSRIDPSDADQMRFMSVVEGIYFDICKHLFPVRGLMNYGGFNASSIEMAVSTGFRSPVYRQNDPLTNMPVAGRPGSIFFNLFTRGKPPLVEQTLFTGLNANDKKPIPWQLLTGVDLKFIPLVHFKRVYVQKSQAKIVAELVSAVVLSVKSLSNNSRQTATIDKYAKESPSLIDSVSAQVATLMFERQDMLASPVAPAPAAAAAPATPPAATEAQPTFAGIVPTGQGNNVPMQDFTANAPIRLN